MKKIKLLLLIALIFGGSYLIYNSIGGDLLKVNPSIIEYQKEIESKFSYKKLEDAEVILNPYDVSPLTAVIPLYVSKEGSITILVDGKFNDTSLTYKYDVSRGENVVPIYGLYPNLVNTVTVKLDDEVKKFNILTGSISDKIPHTISFKSETELIGDEFYFVSPSSNSLLTGYDKRGDIRFFFNKEYSWDLQRLKNGHILVSSERLLEKPYYTTGLLEMDFTGKVFKEYIVNGGYHHDVFEKEDGNLIVLTNDFSKKTVEDEIVEIDKNSGKIVKRIDLKKILPLEEGKNESSTDFDWFHNNSLYLDEKTNLLYLSGRHKDLVAVLDYKTKGLKYLIGPNEGYSEKWNKFFLKPIKNTEMQWAQHAAKITPEGNLFLFDNGLHRSKTKAKALSADENYSRGVIYKMDFDKKTIEEIYSYGKEKGKDFYSPYISDVDYLKKNNYLIHSGGIGSLKGKALDKPAGLVKGAKLKSTTVEVLDGKVIYELTLDEHFYRAEKMKIYSNTDLRPKIGKTLGSFLPTQQSKKKVNKFKVMGKVPKGYELKLTKESDRLEINGKFTKGDCVLIVLENLFGKKVYEARVQEKPYKAMCIDLYNNKTDKPTINLNYFINETGLRGHYKILIGADGKLFETGYTVNFK